MDVREYQKKYRQEHREQNKIYQKKYREEHKEQNKLYQKEYRKNHPELYENRKDYFSNYRKLNKSNANKREKERRKTDLMFYTKRKIKDCLRSAFLRKYKTNPDKYDNILQCTYSYFRQHLLKTFKNNYGRELLEEDYVAIDHIIPLNEANSIDDLYNMSNYKNLQLLLYKDNNKKGTKLNWKII